jgi:hypothetical protein
MRTGYGEIGACRKRRKTYDGVMYAGYAMASNGMHPPSAVDVDAGEVLQKLSGNLLLRFTPLPCD